MEPFEFSEVKDEERFWSVLNQLKNANGEKEMLSALRLLDEYVSSVSKMPTIEMAFDDIDVTGEYIPERKILFSKKYLEKSNWIGLLSTYLHEKRHHLQYSCYLEKSDLLGKDMLKAIHTFVTRDYDVCAITGASVYDGTLGHDGRIMEYDATIYQYEQIIEILNFIIERNPNAILKRELSLIKDNFEFYKSTEYASMIIEHHEKFPVRLYVEEKLLQEVKDKINNGEFDRDLKKLIYSKRLYNCLTSEEKVKISKFVKDFTDRKIRRSEDYLNRTIDKRVASRREALLRYNCGINRFQK